MISTQRRRLRPVRRGQWPRRVQPRWARVRHSLGRWPDNLTASIALGNYYYSAGALKDAEQVLRDANRRHPESVVVMNNLGQTLSDQGQNNEALKLIDKAQAQPSPFSENLRETRELIVQRLKH